MKVMTMTSGSIIYQANKRDSSINDVTNDAW